MSPLRLFKVSDNDCIGVFFCMDNYEKGIGNKSNQYGTHQQSAKTNRFFHQGVVSKDDIAFITVRFHVSGIVGAAFSRDEPTHISLQSRQKATPST
jgi:hypothetical protein